MLFRSHDLPGVSALAEAAALVGADAERWAIGGGEDYELLFAAPVEARDQVRAIGAQCGLPLSLVGTVIAGEGVSLIRPRPDGGVEEIAVAYQGFDHFRNTRAGG